MTENSVFITEFWEREVEMLNKIASIRLEIEQEVILGRAEIRYLIDRHIAIDKLQASLKALKAERETADDGQSDITTVPPPKYDREESLEEPLDL
jgi:hypothetical protein